MSTDQEHRTLKRWIAHAWLREQQFAAKLHLVRLEIG
jgi:hypothetical protein